MGKIEDPCQLCGEMLDEENVEAITYCHLCNQKKADEKKLKSDLGVDLND